MRMPARSMSASTGRSGISRSRKTSSSWSVTSSGASRFDSCRARSARSPAKFSASSGATRDKRHRLGAPAAHVFLGQRLVAEVLERGLLERVAGPRRVQQVAGEHRVEREAAQRDAVVLQDDEVELQIVADLADRLVFEQRLQPLERRAAVHLRRRRRRPAGRRRPPRPRGPAARSAPADRAVENAMPTIAARIADGRSGMTRSANSPAARSSAISASSSCERRDERVVLLDRVRRRRVLVDQRAERQTREELVAALARRAAVAQRLEVDVERHVAPDRHELAAAQRLVAMRRRAPRVLLLRQLGGLVEQRVEAAVRR